MQMDALTLEKEMKRKKLDLKNAQTLEQKRMIFERSLKIVIPPKHYSDRVSFERISNWLADRCRYGDLDEQEVFSLALDFALEASGRTVRNPAAVFTYLMKRKLGYSTWTVKNDYEHKQNSSL